MVNNVDNKDNDSYELENSSTTTRDVDLYIGNNFMTNADRLHTILSNNLERINTKPTNWKLPLSLLVTLVITLISAEFVDRFGVPKSIWISVTVILAVLSMFWLISAIVRDYNTKKKKLTVEELVTMIENKPTGKIKD